MEAHDLHHEFPLYHDKILELKSSDVHFRRLFDEYHETNKEIQRIEQTGVFTDDELNGMRQKRSHLKDELFSALTA